MSRITGRDETIIRTAYLWGQTDNSTGWSFYVSATSGLGFPEADDDIDLAAQASDLLGVDRHPAR